jgi:hypothetical protein
LVCSLEESCVFCGSYEQPCCLSNECDKGFTCEADGMCYGCGVGLPCDGNTCNEGYYFEEADGRCYPYGYLDYRCGDEDQCVGWFECLEGICVNPFLVDSTTSISICGAAEPGVGPSEQDWCLWYAAYLKEDRSICESIDWGQMREKCLGGKDPANYYILPPY